MLFTRWIVNPIVTHLDNINILIRERLAIDFVHELHNAYDSFFTVSYGEREDAVYEEAIVISDLNK